MAGYTQDLRDKLLVQQSQDRTVELLHQIIHSTPLCLNVWSEQHENIQCNQQAVSLFGLSSEKEYLDRFFELSPAYQPDGQRSSTKAHEKIATAFRDGHCRFEWQHCKLDGTPIPAEITLNRISVRGEPLVVGYTRDMRNQLKAEEDLRLAPLCTPAWCSSALKNGVMTM